ncbi:hypothetical protein TNCV_1191951 [Trichonephila clavipes]|nr:hypothetical protein TNCV_1191951 [Trichonephila clavipes]
MLSNPTPKPSSRPTRPLSSSSFHKYLPYNNLGQVTIAHGSSIVINLDELSPIPKAENNLRKSRKTEEMEKSLNWTRKDFKQVIAEFDRQIQRGDSSSKGTTNQHKTRGHFLHLVVANHDNISRQEEEETDERNGQTNPGIGSTVPDQLSECRSLPDTQLETNHTINLNLLSAPSMYLLAQ